MMRLVSLALVALLALPARALDCDPGDEACILAVEVHEVTHERDAARANVDRLTRELTACRATQGVCEGLVVPAPAVKPAPYPWPVIVATGSLGVVAGIILGLKLAR